MRFQVPEAVQQVTNVIYRIGPMDRLVYKEDAPEAIQEDLLFKALLADGSIDVIETAAQKKAAEQDPTAGALADGKKPVKAKAEVKAETKTEEKPSVTGQAAAESPK